MTVTSPSDITVTWSDRQFSKWQADGRSQYVLVDASSALGGRSADEVSTHIQTIPKEGNIKFELSFLKKD